jgi:hypothetical protein
MFFASCSKNDDKTFDNTNKSLELRAVAHGKQSGNCNNPDCTGFVDANGDGKCDNCIGTCTGTGARPQDGTGNQYGKGAGNRNNPDCTGFVDADGDGKCDNCTGTCTGTGARPQDGTGNQHGKGKK